MPTPNLNLQTHPKKNYPQNTHKSKLSHFDKNNGRSIDRQRQKFIGRKVNSLKITKI
jgi:hypothetical protein